MKKILFVFIVAIYGLTACSSGGKHAMGVYMLVDTSGTYTNSLKKAQRIINYILINMHPGDTFAVAQVNTGSFTEKNIIRKQTFDSRPSMTNEQKIVFKKSVDRFIRHVRPSAYTDITGGILQGIEFLNEVNPGRKIILIFSDLKEELRHGYVRNIPLKLKGIQVIALNVTKLRSDNVDPREYMGRLAKWKARVVTGGGDWKVINDLDRLEPIFQ